jgi:hypothetical protein
MRTRLADVLGWTATSIVTLAALGAAVIVGAGIVVAFPFVLAARALVVR